MPMSHKNKTKRKTIQQSDPGKLLDLIMNLTDDKCSEIQKRVNMYLSDECEADLVLQVIVQCDRKEAFIEVVGALPLLRKMKVNISHKLNETLTSRLEQVDLVTNFDQDFQTIIEPHVPKDNPKKRIVMMAVQGNPFSVIFCVVAPKILEENVATLIHECALFAWPTLKKAIAFDNECILKEKCQQLLRAAKKLFIQVASLESLLQLVMDQARHLTNAEYCSIMLIDVDKMELYEACSPTKNTTNTERCFPLNIGIAGEVMKTGTLINARNAQGHPLFCPYIDNLPNDNCRNLLCFPIRDQSGIIGVGQLINKLLDPYFDAMDEEIALSFSIHCGICIIHSVIYQKIQEAHIRNALANELVMYHMKVSDAEVNQMMTCTGFHKHPEINSLHFNPRALPLRELPCYALNMFLDLRFDKKFNIMPQKLARFILYVKKGYRDVPFHSWTHAFNVGQWAYAALINYKLVPQGYFNDLQALMYLLACFLHDIDHRGTINSFQIQEQSDLVALYSSEGSVMERHHLAQSMCILNTEGCDILASLPRRDYDRAIMMLRNNILATDLANYFSNLDEYRAIAMDFQKCNRIHFSALQCLLMVAADHSDQIKDWGCVKKTAAAVLTEFFKQGDEIDNPALYKDKDTSIIPDLEIEFLQATCLPLYEVLGQMIPNVASYTKIIEGHIEWWEASRSVFSEVPVIEGLSVLLSPELDNLIELNMKEMERLEKERLEAELAAAQKLEEQEEDDDE